MRGKHERQIFSNLTIVYLSILIVNFNLILVFRRKKSAPQRGPFSCHGNSKSKTGPRCGANARQRNSLEIGPRCGACFSCHENSSPCLYCSFVVILTVSWSLHLWRVKWKQKYDHRRNESNCQNVVVHFCQRCFKFLTNLSNILYKINTS